MNLGRTPSAAWSAALSALAVLLFPPARRLVARVAGLERVPGPLPLLVSDGEGGAGVTVAKLVKHE